MTTINRLILEADDADAARKVHEALGVAELMEYRDATSPASGFRGFTVSVLVGQPADVDQRIGAATAAGATELKPITTSMWGYGGVLQAPDGSIWKVATSAKGDDPATGEIGSVVLLLGATDVKASKRCYVDQGFAVGKSFVNRYVEFELSDSPIKLVLYPRRGLAQDAGVDVRAAAGETGSPRMTVVGGTTAFTDPDGFAWQPGTPDAA